MKTENLIPITDPDLIDFGGAMIPFWAYHDALGIAVTREAETKVFRSLGILSEQDTDL